MVDCACVCVCVLSPDYVVGQRARVVRVSEEWSILLISATDRGHMVWVWFTNKRHITSNRWTEWTTGKHNVSCVSIMCSWSTYLVFSCTACCAQWNGLHSKEQSDVSRMQVYSSNNIQGHVCLWCHIKEYWHLCRQWQYWIDPTAFNPAAFSAQEVQLPVFLPHQFGGRKHNTGLTQEHDQHPGHPHTLMKIFVSLQSSSILIIIRKKRENRKKSCTLICSF